MYNEIRERSDRLLLHYRAQVIWAFKKNFLVRKKCHPCGSHELKSKRKQLNIRLHLFRSILKSNISLHDKILIYKTLKQWPVNNVSIKALPPWNIHPLQAFQAITFTLITVAPFLHVKRRLQEWFKINNY